MTNDCRSMMLIAAALVPFTLPAEALALSCAEPPPECPCDRSDDDGEALATRIDGRALVRGELLSSGPAGRQMRVDELLAGAGHLRVGDVIGSASNEGGGCGDVDPIATGTVVLAMFLGGVDEASCPELTTCASELCLTDPAFEECVAVCSANAETLCSERRATALLSGSLWLSPDGQGQFDFGSPVYEAAQLDLLIDDPSGAAYCDEVALPPEPCGGSDVDQAEQEESGCSVHSVTVDGAWSWLACAALLVRRSRARRNRAP